MEEPLITVGIPAYNAGKYLKLAIDSVLRQSLRNFELIVINDGSTDNSSEILSHYRDPRLRVISDGVNKGLIKRLNEMVAMAGGTYFARMDADDIMFPDRLKKQLEFLQAHVGTDICSASAVSIDKDNRILGIKHAVAPRSREDVMNGTVPIHPTVFAKTSFFRENPYHEGFHQMEDWELWYRAVESHRFGCVEEPLLFYREDSIPNSAKHKKMYAGLEKFADTHNLSAAEKDRVLKDSKKKYYLYKLLETFGLEGILLRRRYRSGNTEPYSGLMNDILQKNK